MHRLFRVVAVLALAAPPAAISAGSAPAQPNEADLAVTAAVVGHGKPKAALGQFVQETFAVTNNGPATASGLSVSPLASDHFNTIEVTCTEGPGRIPCPDTIASGQTVTGEIVFQVCCMPRGDSRNGFVGVFAGATTPDPVDTNNSTLVTVKIIGRHGFVGIP